MKLKAYQNMPEDERWPHAQWPEEKAFEDAHNFIQHLDLNSVPMPIVTLADDGEVNFLWKPPLSMLILVSMEQVLTPTLPAIQTGANSLAKLNRRRKD